LLELITTVFAAVAKVVTTIMLHVANMHNILEVLIIVKVVIPPPAGRPTILPTLLVLIIVLVAIMAALQRENLAFIFLHTIFVMIATPHAHGRSQDLITVV